MKKTYAKPVVTTHGAVEVLTLNSCTNKSLGGSDGLTFNGTPIEFNCS